MSASNMWQILSKDKKAIDWVEPVDSLIGELDGFRLQFVESIDDQNNNTSLLKSAIEHLESIGESISLSTVDIIAGFESQDGPTANEVHNLHYNWGRFMEEVRCYIAFHGAESLAQSELFRQGAIQNIKTLRDIEDSFNDVQLDAIDDINELIPQYFDLWEKAKNMYGYHVWRRDKFLLKNN